MHKKNYHFLVLGLIFSAFVLIGCSNNQKTEETIMESNTNDEYENSEEAAYETETEDDTNDDYEDDEDYEDEAVVDNHIDLIYKFNEGVQWVKNSSVNDLYDGYICVDKEGNALFSINNPDITNVSNFQNGYSFIETNDAIYEIDLNGNITNSYMISDNITFKTYADGQIWMEEYNSGFDSAAYVYTLYDENGKKLTEFSVEGTEPLYKIDYCGKGVWHCEQGYYCTQSDKWIEDNYGSVYFDEDTIVLDLRAEDSDDSDNTDHKVKKIMMDTKGNITEEDMTVETEWVWAAAYDIKDGYCVMKDYEDHLVSFNVSSGEIKVMDNEYAETINWDWLPDDLVFTDGRIVLPLTGKDEEEYIGLFDTSWNIVGEPIRCGRYELSEGRLVAVPKVLSGDGSTSEQIIVYDTNFAQVFNGSEKGYKAITPYKSGVAYVLNEDAGSLLLESVDTLFGSADDYPILDGEWKPIDENGEYLYDTINMDHIKAVELK